VIGPADVELFADWTIAFLREAVPHDPLPSRERLCGSPVFLEVSEALANTADRTTQTATDGLFRF
jgi:hypothetical protein